jgi:hypothetical protein
MRTPTEKFRDGLRNLEGAYRRLDTGQLTGRNSTASDDGREWAFRELAKLVHEHDEVTDALDANVKLAERWSRMERRHYGLPGGLRYELKQRT